MSKANINRKPRDTAYLLVVGKDLVKREEDTRFGTPERTYNGVLFNPLQVVYELRNESIVRDLTTDAIYEVAGIPLSRMDALSSTDPAADERIPVELPIVSRLKLYGTGGLTERLRETYGAESTGWTREIIAIDFPDIDKVISDLQSNPLKYRE